MSDLTPIVAPGDFPASKKSVYLNTASVCLMARRIGIVSAVCLWSAAVLTAQSRPRARDLGIAPGIYPPGSLNAITDVEGVRVGHTTLIEGDAVRTGVTAVLAHGGNIFQDKVAGAVFVGNAFGKLAGSTQVTELGTIETPIVLTNTLSVGVAMDAVVRYVLGRPGNEEVRSVNALVGETNDGGLNDIRGFHVTQKHVIDAIESASAGPVAEGSVGAGTGTVAYGWKAGIGTSSRKVPGGYVVGVLAQTNFGGNLTISGVPIFRLLQPAEPLASLGTPGSRRTSPRAPAGSGDGSCMRAPARGKGVKALERFTAVVLDGHKGLAFELPFSPRARWRIEEVSLWPGRRGYRVRGTVNQREFESVAVPRAKRFFVLVTEQMEKAGRLEAGKSIEVSVEPVA